jgi:hypothetical protein
MILAVGGTGKPGRRVVRLRREQGHEMRLWYSRNPGMGSSRNLRWDLQVSVRDVENEAT